MKKLKRWFREIFEPEDMDIALVAGALNEPAVRNLWLNYCFDEIRRINREVDRHLLSGSETGLLDLCARRKTFQDVLEAVLAARRQMLQTQDGRHNPQSPGDVNLDRVTV